MAALLTGSRETPVCIMGDRRDQLGLHLNQTDLKSGKETAELWPIYQREVG